MVEQSAKNEDKKAKGLQQVDYHPRIFQIFVLFVVLSQSEGDCYSEEPDKDSPADICQRPGNWRYEFRDSDSDGDRNTN